MNGNIACEVDVIKTRLMLTVSASQAVRKQYAIHEQGTAGNGQTYPESSAHRQKLGAIQLAAQRPDSDIIYHM